MQYWSRERLAKLPAVKGGIGAVLDSRSLLCEREAARLAEQFARKFARRM